MKMSKKLTREAKTFPLFSKTKHFKDCNTTVLIIFKQTFSYDFLIF